MRLVINIYIYIYKLQLKIKNLNKRIVDYNNNKKIKYV